MKFENEDYFPPIGTFANEKPLVLAPTPQSPNNIGNINDLWASTNLGINPADVAAAETQRIKGLQVATQRDPYATIPVIYSGPSSSISVRGTAKRLGGIVAEMFTRGDDREVMYVTYLLCHGPIQRADIIDRSYGTTLMPDKNSLGTLFEFDFDENNAHIEVEGYKGNGQIFVHNGDPDLAFAPSWHKDDRTYPGIAHVKMRLVKPVQVVTDFTTNPLFMSGLPNFEFYVHGIDPTSKLGFRSDDTASKMGAYLYDYMISTQYGAGIDPARIDLNSFFEYGAITGEDFDTVWPDGVRTNEGLVQHLFHIDTSRTISQNVQLMLNQMECALVFKTGKYQLRVNNNYLAATGSTGLNQTFRVTETDVIGGMNFNHVPTYVLPKVVRGNTQESTKYIRTFGGINGVLGTQRTHKIPNQADDRATKEYNFSYDGDLSESQLVAQFYDNAYSMMCEMTLTADFINLNIYDILDVSNKFTGIEELFQVVNIRINPNLTVTVQARGLPGRNVGRYASRANTTGLDFCSTGGVGIGGGGIQYLEDSERIQDKVLLDGDEIGNEQGGSGTGNNTDSAFNKSIAIGPTTLDLGVELVAHGPTGEYGHYNVVFDNYVVASSHGFSVALLFRHLTSEERGYIQSNPRLNDPQLSSNFARFPRSDPAGGTNYSNHGTRNWPQATDRTGFRETWLGFNNVPYYSSLDDYYRLPYNQDMTLFYQFITSENSQLDDDAATQWHALEFTTPGPDAPVVRQNVTVRMKFPIAHRHFVGFNLPEQILGYTIQSHGGVIDSEGPKLAYGPLPTNPNNIFSDPFLPDGYEYYYPSPGSADDYALLEPGETKTAQLSIGEFGHLMADVTFTRPIQSLPARFTGTFTYKIGNNTLTNTATFVLNDPDPVLVEEDGDFILPNDQLFTEQTVALPVEDPVPDDPQGIDADDPGTIEIFYNKPDRPDLDY